jgi:hypothetical protein
LAKELLDSEVPVPQPGELKERWDIEHNAVTDNIAAQRLRK